MQKGPKAFEPSDRLTSKSVSKKIHSKISKKTSVKN